MVRMCRRGNAARNDRIKVERFVVGVLVHDWICQERCCMWEGGIGRDVVEEGCLLKDHKNLLGGFAGTADD